MLLGLLTLALHGAPAQAPVEIRWESEPQCIDEPALEAQIVELAGQPKSPVVLAATAVESGWEIRVAYEAVERVVESDDCAVLTDAVALIVAVRVDAIRTAVSIEPDPAPEPAPVPEPEPVVPPPTESPARAASTPPPPPVEPPRSHPPTLPTLMVGVGGDLGTLPRGGATLRLDAGVRRGGLELDAGAIATLGPDSADREGVRSSFRMFAGLAQACWRLESAKVEVPLCGRAELGVLQARPEGLTRPNDRDGLWVAPGLRVAAAPVRGRFAPEGFLEVAAPLQRHVFEVADASIGVLHRLPPAVMRVGIALRWRGRG